MDSFKELLDDTFNKDKPRKDEDKIQVEDTWVNITV